MSDSKSKFTTPASFPVTSRVAKEELRQLSTALVGSVFAADLKREIVDPANAEVLALFSLTPALFNALPPANVHPDQIAADAGWYKRYEDKWQLDTRIGSCGFSLCCLMMSSICALMTLAAKASSTALPSL